MDLTLGLFSNRDILITDEFGIVTEINENFKNIYGYGKEDIVGRSVFELEEEEIFKPSAAAKVLKENSEVVVLQRTESNRNLIVIGLPVRNTKDKIVRVVTYSIDAEEYIKLKEWTEELHYKIDYYNCQINNVDINKDKYKANLIDYINQDDEVKDIMSDVITKNVLFKNILNNVIKLAKYNVNMLLLGETGVGKTMLAKKIHQLSDYKNGEFVEVNCGAIPPDLIESELFGYSKGAFTGANREGKKGLIEIAEGGTLFLDEVCEMPMQTQAKFLKVLQDKNVRRIGATKSQNIDCRIITATNKNLEEEVSKGNFRLDLLYRLNTITIDIPSLKNRPEDIPHLSEYFMKKYNKKYRENKIISHKALDTISKYNWPGNIRELENTIQRLILVSEANLITEKELPKHLTSKKNINNSYKDVICDLNKSIEDFESEIIRECYNKHKSSIKVAKALNISQTTAARKIKKYIKE